MPIEPALVLSCEHGGNRIPARWSGLFRDDRRLLDSHRGWDPGALDVARSLARRLGAPLVAATTSRLLIDLNRSPHNPRIWSERTRRLDPVQRAELIAGVHTAHWDRLRARLDAVGARRVLHVAVHSFTPRLGRERRDFDVGLLYDPARPAERRWAARAKRELAGAAPDLRVRRNAPYRGSADGLTTAMRRERRGGRYLGIELELNQASLADRRRRGQLVDALVALLRTPPGDGPRSDIVGFRGRR